MTERQFTAQLDIDSSAQPARVAAKGDWVLAHYRTLEPEVTQLRANLPATVVFDLSQLGAMDTAGATLLALLLGEERVNQLRELAPTLPEERRVLLETVSRVLPDLAVEPPKKPSPFWLELLSNIGRSMDNLWQDFKSLLGFVGLTLEALFSTMFRPSRWRMTSLIANIQQIGLNAVPIIMLLTFLVGAVIAFLGATVLTTFGAGIFTVDLVVFSFLREFAVLLTAILMAGRTASAFTAEIGLMKANEEIDAIQTLGLNPVELLVLPRVLALLISLPMLTFIGMICGIFGGMVVCALALNISPTMFLSIMQSSNGLQHFLVGISKAPVFAFLIAIIGCLEGFKVTGSAESVGVHTTTSVVHSIFVVILLDAVAALFFMEMGW
ncbi:ABC transporter permease [Yersinia massiliensis]|jgi:phospholipid/cholesterol/gamma-HCH transport system permease protein|uniref:ABC transporter permease n=2 Tax=Yersinia TaxID=629 RepID=A0A2R4NML2_9GAMM|nr:MULTISPECIES: ABC transporter permease [Yersinia]HEI6965151.1 ABC transporter permease [Yersinia enterocolitica]AVX37369.1 ABC transporter permease [Yersinia massiliensis]MDA5546245.1 ABC transporter permease [Yersinia massiliensis]MDN0128959.1 ABC transporter permease [Yersinia massiliensis]NIL27284.1 ABC transporter permease [Yersinia massiliensis]